MVSFVDNEVNIKWRSFANVWIRRRGRAERINKMDINTPETEIKKENKKTKYACYIPSYLLDKPRTKYELFFKKFILNF